VNYINHDIVKAAKTLLEICDGAITEDGKGYNGYDSEFVRSVLSRNFVSFKQLNAIYKILRKYKKQLLNYFNILYEELELPKEIEVKKFQKVEIISEIYMTKNNKFNQVQLRLKKQKNKIPYDSFIHIKDVFKNNGFRYDSIKTEWYYILNDYKKDYEIIENIKNSIDSSISKIKYERNNELIKEIEQKKINDKKAIEESYTMEAKKLTEIKGLTYKPYPFQLAMVEYMENRKNVLVGDEMGLGKTIEAIATIQHYNLYPAVIIVPAMLKKNWEKEIIKWLPNKRLQVFNGKDNIVDKNADLYLINYDIVYGRKTKKTKKPRSYLKEIFDTKKIKMTVCDESHYVKNPKTNRSKIIKQCVKKSERKLLMTGTPILNRVTELINQLDILGELKAFGGIGRFKRKYCKFESNGFGWVVKNGTKEQLNQLQEDLRINCMIRRLKTDVLTELPDKQRSTIEFELTNSELKEYKNAEKDLMSWYKIKLEDTNLTKKQKQELIRNKQFNAEALTKIEYLKQAVIKSKMEKVFDWIDNTLEQEDKLVIFATHRKVVQDIYEKYKNIAVKLQGGDGKEVNNIVDQFQNNKDIKLFIGNIKSSGVGLTLTASKIAAFIEFPWTPGELHQAEDRIHRIGQKNAVNIYNLIVPNTIDEDMLNLISDKQEGIHESINISSIINKIKSRKNK